MDYDAITDTNLAIITRSNSIAYISAWDHLISTKPVLIPDFIGEVPISLVLWRAFRNESLRNNIGSRISFIDNDLESLTKMYDLMMQEGVKSRAVISKCSYPAGYQIRVSKSFFDKEFKISGETRNLREPYLQVVEEMLKTVRRVEISTKQSMQKVL